MPLNSRMPLTMLNNSGKILKKAKNPNMLKLSLMKLMKNKRKKQKTIKKSKLRLRKQKKRLKKLKKRNKFNIILKNYY
jgi:hypothetical protein